jgi:DNA-binding MarR family transcriptional regulator
MKYVPVDKGDFVPFDENCAFSESVMRSSGRGIALWQRMSKLKRSVWDPTEREMRKAGFPPPEHYDALCILSRADKGGMPMAGLEAELSIPQYATSRIVAHLEGKGLVRRTASESDRRVQLIEITAFGRNLATTIWDAYQLAMEKRPGSELWDIDFSWLNTVLDRIDSSIDARR